MYSSPGYWVLSIFFALLVFSFNPLISNIPLLLSTPSFKLFFSLILGAHSAVALSKQLTLGILAILSGIVISMVVFVVQRQVHWSAATNLSGVLVGIIAPACPSCALGLLSLLGLGSFLAILPFKGAELNVLALILLTFSVVYLSKKINTLSCTLKEQRTLKKKQSEPR